MGASEEPRYGYADLEDNDRKLELDEVGKKKHSWDSKR